MFKRRTVRVTGGGDSERLPRVVVHKPAKPKLPSKRKRRKPTDIPVEDSDVLVPDRWQKAPPRKAQTHFLSNRLKAQVDCLACSVPAIQALAEKLNMDPEVNTIGDVLAANMIFQAFSDKPEFLKELLNRVEGKVPDVTIQEQISHGIGTFSQEVRVIILQTVQDQSLQNALLAQLGLSEDTPLRETPAERFGRMEGIASWLDILNVARPELLGGGKNGGSGSG